MVASLGQDRLQLDGPAQVLHRQEGLAHRGVGQPPVVPGVGVLRGQQDGQIEVAERPFQVAQLGLARPPAVVGHRVAGGQPDGGVVVLHRQVVLLHTGPGAGPALVSVGVGRVPGDDTAVVLRRQAVLPQFVVQQPPVVPALVVLGVGLDLPAQPLHHPANALAAQGVHHPPELAPLLRRLPRVQSFVFPGHGAPPPRSDGSPPDGLIVAGMAALWATLGPLTGLWRTMTL